MTPSDEANPADSELKAASAQRAKQVGIGLAAAALAGLAGVGIWQLRQTDTVPGPRTEEPRASSPKAQPSAPVENGVHPPHSDPRSPITQPPYPAISKQLQEEGAVVLLLTIDEAGNVAGAAIDQSSGFASLDEAALGWSGRWTFMPGTVDGKPTTMQYKFRVVFRLADTR